MGRALAAVAYVKRTAKGTIIDVRQLNLKAHRAGRMRVPISNARTFENLMNTDLRPRRLGVRGATALAWVFAVSMAYLSTGAAPADAARELPDFTGLVEKYSPAVVNVSTTQKAPARGETNPDMDEFFRRFFGPDGRPQPPDGGGSPYGPRRSLGSGFI